MNIHPDNRTAYEAQANLIIANQETARADFLARPSIMLGVVPMNGGGGLWIAKYGGLHCVGKTPDQAMEAFDRMWYGKYPGPDPK